MLSPPSILIRIPAQLGSYCGEALKWKSNKEVTLQYLKTHTKLTSQQLDKLGPILGKMVIVFDSERMTAKSGNWKFTTKYTIIEETRNTVTIEAEDPGYQEIDQDEIHVGRKRILDSRREDSRLPGTLR